MSLLCLCALAAATTACERKAGGTDPQTAIDEPASKGANKETDKASPPTSDRKQGADPTKATADGAANKPAEAALDDQSDPPIGPLDVAARIYAPTLDPDLVDAALSPVVDTLRAAPGVELTVARAMPGEARLLVRFGAKSGPRRATRLVERALREAKRPGLARWIVAPWPRGGRASLALAVQHPGGPTESAAWLRGCLAEAGLREPRVELWGTAEDAVIVELLPGTLGNFDIALHRAAQAVVDAVERVADAASPGLSAGDAATQLLTALKATALPRGLAAREPNLPAVAPERLVHVTSGRIATGRAALVAQQELDAVVVVGATEEAETRAAQTAIDTACGTRAKKAALPGLRVSPLSVGLTMRYRLVAPAAMTGGRDAMVKALQAAMVKLRDSGLAFNIVAVAGIDGVPALLQPETDTGRQWTLWAARRGTTERAVAETEVRRVFAEGAGFDVVALAPRRDDLLAWTVGSSASTGSVVSTPDGAKLADVIGALATGMRAAGVAKRFTSGPRTQPVPEALTRIALQTVRERRVPPAGLEAAMSLTGEGWRLGPIGAVPVRFALASQAQTHTLPNLPLTDDKEPVTWSTVRRLPAPREALDRVRVDGRPALWFGVDLRGGDLSPLANGAWTATEQYVELSPGMAVHALESGRPALRWPGR